VESERDIVALRLRRPNGQHFRRRRTTAGDHLALRSQAEPDLKLLGHRHPSPVQELGRDRNVGRQSPGGPRVNKLLPNQQPRGETVAPAKTHTGVEGATGGDRQLGGGTRNFPDRQLAAGGHTGQATGGNWGHTTGDRQATGDRQLGRQATGDTQLSLVATGDMGGSWGTGGQLGDTQIPLEDQELSEPLSLCRLGAGRHLFRSTES
jgi:hypothetical protein